MRLRSRITEFAHHEFIVAGFCDTLGSLGPTCAGRTGGPAQHQCTILNRHFHSCLRVQTQLRQYRFWDDDSLGVADLSNAHVHSPHSNNNVIPSRLVCQARMEALRIWSSQMRPRRGLPGDPGLAIQLAVQQAVLLNTAPRCNLGE